MQFKTLKELLEVPKIPLQNLKAKMSQLLSHFSLIRFASPHQSYSNHILNSILQCLLCLKIIFSNNVSWETFRVFQHIKKKILMSLLVMCNKLLENSVAKNNKRSLSDGFCESEVQELLS